MNQPPLHPRTIQRIVEASFGDALHAKQRESIGHCVIGALHTDRAGVAAIGRAAARRRGKVDKHGIKQFDRYLSNDKVLPQVFLPRIADDSSRRAKNWSSRSTGPSSRPTVIRRS
jgi:hypothetical protein